jgi:hypothetical protein
VKRQPGRKVFHSLLSSAEVMKEWSSTFIPPYFFMVWRATDFFKRGTLVILKFWKKKKTKKKWTVQQPVQTQYRTNIFAATADNDCNNNLINFSSF